MLHIVLHIYRLHDFLVCILF